jgi:hypothetical protein
MFTKAEKQRFGRETREHAEAIWELREKVIASVATIDPAAGKRLRFQDVGPAADLLRAYHWLADCAKRWDGE